MYWPTHDRELEPPEIRQQVFGAATDKPARAPGGGDPLLASFFGMAIDHFSRRPAQPAESTGTGSASPSSSTDLGFAFGRGGGLQRSGLVDASAHCVKPM